MPLLALAGAIMASPKHTSVVRAQKMTPNDDPEAFINAFERITIAAGWPTMQWSAILILCFIRPTQQAMDTLPLQDLCDYKKVKTAILQSLNLNPEANQWHLHKIEFGPNYHPCLIGQKIKATCLKWLRPTECTSKEVAESVCVEHYVALLLKWWVTCQQPQTLENTIFLMKAYMSTKAGIYLWKNLQKQVGWAVQGKCAHKGNN